MSTPLPEIERKAIKRRYKEGRRPMGVFCLRNLRDGRRLVLSSVDLPSMFNRLRMQLRTGTCVKYPELQRDWKELGAEAFSFEVLEQLEPAPDPAWDPSSDLETLEGLWLEELAPYDERGYNRRPRRR
jgi:hypothetical protein